MSEDATLDEFVQTEKEVTEKQSVEKVSIGKLQQLEVSPIESWDLSKLGEILSLEYGDNLPSDNREVGDIPVYGSNGQIDTHSEAAVDNSGIVLGRKGSIGEIEFSDRPFWPIDTTYYITREETNQNLRFLYYLLQNIQLERLNAASAIPGLNRNDAYGLNALVPPLEEQHKIATVLHNIDQTIQKTEEIIRQTQRVKRGVAQNLFHYGIDRKATTQTWLGEIPKSWDVIQFSEIVDSNRNGLYKSEEAYGDGYPIAKMGNALENRILDMSTADRLTLTEPEKEKYALKQDDLIFARRAQEVSAAGDCCYVPDLDELTVFESSLIRVNISNNDNPKFYTQYFEGPIGSRSIERITTKTSISGIATSDLLDLKVAHPTLEEQIEIASILWEFDNQAKALRNEVDQLQRLKKSLMQDLLSGKVRTTDTSITIPDEIQRYG